MPIPGTPSRAELVEHLVATRIAGEVATPRENNLSHYRKLANGDRHYWLGLELGERWTDEQDVLAVMAERVGVNDDPEHRYGQDTIDPELTVDGLERMAGRLRKAAEGRSGCCWRPVTRAACWTCTGRRPPRCGTRAATSWSSRTG
ncbi:hypothetical protein STENM223S_02100 [Streptomyces tendae]